MVHVDALSRAVNYVETFFLEKELQYRQLQDPKLKSIAKDLQFEVHEKFELIENLVFRKGLDKPRFVPAVMIINIIRIYHDEIAHCGAEKTIQGIGANYWFPSLRRRVKNYIDNCIMCLMANSAVNSREGEMQITDTPISPLEIIHVDHLGPIKGSSSGFKHVLVVIDAFSRYT